MERIPVLVVMEGPLKGRKFPLVEGEGNTIGRAENCNITIPDDDVSRQHARIILHNAAVWVQDDNSRNGVFVNDKRVVRRPLELRPGGKVSIGIHVFQLELQEPEEHKEIQLPTIENEEEASKILWFLLIGLAVVGVVVALFLQS